MFSATKPNLQPKSILITGASSGIGAALASAYARPGVTLFLLGRNEARLNNVAENCRSLGASVEAIVMDVSHDNEMADMIKRIDLKSPLDLVIANAGVARNHEDKAFARELVKTNINGILNTVEPAVELMSERQAGQIAIVSSLSAFRALGGPPGYAASKAWGRLYGEALRGRLARKGVAVNVICPGFVSTPMTEKSDKDGMSSKRASYIIKDGLSKNVARISFPQNMFLQTWWLSVLPSWWSDRKIMKKWRAAAKTPH